MSLTRRTFLGRTVVAAITAPLLAAAASRATEEAPLPRIIDPRAPRNERETLNHIRYLQEIHCGLSTEEESYGVNELELVSRYGSDPVCYDWFRFSLRISGYGFVQGCPSTDVVIQIYRGVMWIGAKQSAGDGIIVSTYSGIPVIGDLVVEFDSRKLAGIAHWVTAAGKTQFPWIKAEPQWRMA